MEIAIGVGFLMVAVIGSWQVRKSVQHKREMERRERLRQAFRGARGGVWVREPNGSRHIFQNMVEQRLSSLGMELHDLSRDPVELLIKEGKWDPAIATGVIHVVVVGRIITDQVVETEVVNPDRYNYESDLSYRARCENLARVYKTNRARYTLDVRFYRPNGMICGACSAAFVHRRADEKPLESLVDQLLDQLGESLSANQLAIIS